MDFSLTIPEAPEEETIILNSDQASLGRSSTYRVCHDVLKPSVRSGNLAEVRAVLKSLATGGGLEEAKEAVARCGIASLARPGEVPRVEFSEVVDTATEQYDILKECVNFVCRSTGRTVLSLAVENEDVSVVEELLKHGADPNIPDHNRVDLVRMPLERAALSGNIEMAKLLISAGAIVTMAVWDAYWLSDEIDIDLSILTWIRLLSHEFTQPTPVYYAAALWNLVQVETLEESDIHPIVGNISWHFDSAVGLGVVIRVLLFHPPSRSLLQTPVRNKLEVFRKSFFLQGLLVYICCDWGEVVDVEQLLSILLREGASFHGWTYSHAVATQKAMWFLDSQWEVADEQLLAERCDVDTGSQTQCVVAAMNRGSWWCRYYFPNQVVCKSCQEFWNRDLDVSCCAPYGVTERSFSTMVLCCLPAILAWLMECTSVVSVKQAAQGALDAGLWTSLRLSSIPSTADSHSPLSGTYDQCYLCVPINLDGGTDTPAKRLRSYICSECVIQPLKSLCRDTILSACQQHSPNVFFAVQQLPLPPMQKIFLLTC